MSTYRQLGSRVNSFRFRLDVPSKSRYSRSNLVDRLKRRVTISRSVDDTRLRQPLLSRTSIVHTAVNYLAVCLARRSPPQTISQGEGEYKVNLPPTGQAHFRQYWTHTQHRAVGGEEDVALAKTEEPALTGISEATVVGKEIRKGTKVVGLGEKRVPSRVCDKNCQTCKKERIK